MDIRIKDDGHKWRILWSENGFGSIKKDGSDNVSYSCLETTYMLLNALRRERKNRPEILREIDGTIRPLSLNELDVLKKARQDGYAYIAVNSTNTSRNILLFDREPDIAGGIWLAGPGAQCISLETIVCEMFGQYAYEVCFFPWLKKDDCITLDSLIDGPVTA